MSTSTRTRIRHTPRVAVPAAANFIDLAVKDAAPRLGLSEDALWGRLRRAEPDGDGMVQLGGGIAAYKLGQRAWRVRFPAEPASA